MLACFIFLLLSGSQALRAQGSNDADKKKDADLVQLSGIISSSEGKVGIPYSTVRIRHTFRGTISGVDGFYSLVAKEKDTIDYGALGFKTVTFVIGTGIKDQKLTHSVGLATDTITFPITQINPFPTPEAFKQAFLSLKLQDSMSDYARKNLDQAKMQELYETLAKDGQEQQLYTLQAIASSYYYAGGQKNYMMLGSTPVPTSLLNPFAWAEFIKAIKEGKFKKKKE
jgi:hypothetical protein